MILLRFGAQRYLDHSPVYTMWITICTYGLHTVAFPPAHTEAVSVVVKPTTPPDLRLLTHLFLAAVDRGREWASLTLARIIHDSSSRNRQAAL